MSIGTCSTASTRPPTTSITAQYCAHVKPWGRAARRTWPAPRAGATIAAVDSLLLVVAELVAVPRLVAAVLLLAIGGGALLVLGQWTFGRRLRARLLRWWRRLLWAAVGGLGVLLLGLLLIDLLLFAPALRIALDQVELRSGVDVNFQRARGSLFTGRLELEDVSVRRSGGGLDFSLSVRELVVDVDMLGLLSDALPIAELRAAGVRGSLVRSSARAPGPARRFAIASLDLRDVQLDFEDTITAPFRNLPLEFEVLQISPLRSDYAMLDVLCGSEARGSARGHRFGAGGHAWQARGIPVGPAAHKLGAAGRWIRGGDLDVTLRCVGDRDAAQVSLAVDLRLHNFKIAPPGDSGRSVPVSRITDALTRLGPEIQFHFSFSLPRERFHGASNVGSLGLWEGAIQAWNIELGTRLGLTGDDLRMLGVGSRVLDRLRQDDRPAPERRRD